MSGCRGTQGLNPSFPVTASFTLWQFWVQALMEYRSPLHAAVVS